MNLLHSQMTQRKEYLEKISVQLEKRLREFPQGNLRVSNNNGFPRYYHVLNPNDTRGQYITKENKDFAKQLAQKDYDRKLYKKVTAELADMYYEIGIPYRYEAELVLKDGKKKYPDFTLLKTSTREIIYHEHFGLLDDEEYREANFAKLEEYRKNGIYLGKNLILTYEAEGYYLNIKDVKKMVGKFLKE